MVTLEDLGITTTLPDFCHGCEIAELTLHNETLYWANLRYIQNANVSCSHIRTCEALYERLKKEGKLKDEVTS